MYVCMHINDRPDSKAVAKELFALAMHVKLHHHLKPEFISTRLSS